MHRRCETDGDDRHQQIKIERGELAAERARAELDAYKAAHDGLTPFEVARRSHDSQAMPDDRMEPGIEPTLSEQPAAGPTRGRLRRQRRLDAIAQTARAVTVMSAAMGSITGARQMTMTAISHIQGPAVRPLVTHAHVLRLSLGRAATGAASPGGCRAVGFRPCYKTSIDDANRIG